MIVKFFFDNNQSSFLLEWYYTRLFVSRRRIKYTDWDFLRFLLFRTICIAMFIRLDYLYSTVIRMRVSLILSLSLLYSHTTCIEAVNSNLKKYEENFALFREDIKSSPTTVCDKKSNSFKTIIKINAEKCLYFHIDSNLLFKLTML